MHVWAKPITCRPHKAGSPGATTILWQPRRGMGPTLTQLAGWILQPSLLDCKSSFRFLFCGRSRCKKSSNSNSRTHQKAQRYYLVLVMCAHQGSWNRLSCSGLSAGHARRMLQVQSDPGLRAVGGPIRPMFGICSYAQPRNGGGGRTASLGCGSCGKGRFVRQLPRGFKIWTPASAQIFHKEYKFVVVDICPHSHNAMWCPARAGQANQFGVHNHFDFATVPHHFDNYYFEFTPEPCNHDMQSRLARMSKCHLR